MLLVTSSNEEQEVTVYLIALDNLTKYIHLIGKGILKLVACNKTFVKRFFLDITEMTLDFPILFYRSIYIIYVHY